MDEGGISNFIDGSIRLTVFSNDLYILTLFSSSKNPHTL